MEHNFKYEIGQEINIGNFHAIITNRYIDKKYKRYKRYDYKCLACGYNGKDKDERCIDLGCKCSCCSNKVVVPGINDINTTHPEYVKYFQNGKKEASRYHKNSRDLIYFKCPVCGRIKKTPMTISDIIRYKGFKCVCSDGISIPNKFIYKFAEELNDTLQIKDFKNEFKLDDKFYDMWILNNDNTELLIEMDSGLNHGDIIKKHHPGKILNCKLFVNDMQKDQIAEYHNYHLIRIDCYKSEFDYIKEQITSSELSTLYDLSMISWENILKFISSNLVKEICEYKINHPHLFPSEIAQNFSVSDVTVRKYLKMGNDLGWCHYNSQEEYERYKNTAKERDHYNSIPVAVEDKDGKIYFYKSFEEMDRKSFQDIGIKLERNRASKITKEKGYGLNYKGFNIYRCQQFGILNKEDYI